MGLLRNVRLADVMDPNPPTLPEWMSIHDLVTHAAAYLPHTAFVTQGIDGRVTGLVTAEAVQATDPRLWSSLHLSDLAFPIDRLQVGRTTDSVLITMQRARNGITGQVLVLQGGRPGRRGGRVGDDAAGRGRASPPPPPPPPPPLPPSLPDVGLIPIPPLVRWPRRTPASPPTLQRA